MPIDQISIRNPIKTLLLLQKYLQKWPSNGRGKSVQLDGAISYSNNPSAWIYFEYDQQIWRLHGDTRDVAVDEFIKNPKLLIKKNANGNNVLRLVSSPAKANGWYCYQV